jgi:biotin carboxyl carrier protein
LRRFKVKVNDQVFEVEVEELGGSEPRVTRVPQNVPVTPAASAPVAVPATRVPAGPVPQVAPAAPKAPSSQGGAKSTGGSGDEVRAPIPGVVSELRVSAGKSVKRGEVLLMLEAMKMQNEIPAPFDGVVQEVAVSQGTSVQTGDVLVRLQR